MAFIANTEQDTREMLSAIGVADVEELFADIPEKVRLKESPIANRPLSEYETLRLLRQRAEMNRPAAIAFSNFMGAGSYEHFIPAAVQAIAQRGELLTAYTPYQAEASQGTLQIIYEFQTMICALTDLDAANASMYDGASALAEAILMAHRINGKNQVVLPETLHPAYAQVIRSYTHNLGIEIVFWKSANGVTNPDGWPAEATNATAVVIPQPNFWGCLEHAEALADTAHKHGALAVAVVNPMSLSALAPPGQWRADIAVGEAQPIGLPMNFGGPYTGFMATRVEHIRKMPGRIVGKTQDHDGREGFVLTLQTREQHIRRERATSNICTNQGLCATMVTLWLSLLGKSGFEKLGLINLDRSGRLRDGLLKIRGVRPFSDAPFFNEFTLRLPMEAEKFYQRMREKGILSGLPASRLGFADAVLLIVCATETKLDEDIENYLKTAKTILEQQS